MPRVISKKLSDGTLAWYAEYRDSRKGYTVRERVSADDRQEAESRLGELLIRANDPVKASLSQVTVDGLVAKYYVEVGKNLPSKYVYKAALDHVVEELPGKTVEWFGSKEQEAFVAALRGKGLADGTIQRIMSVINRSLNWAYQRRMIREKPYVLTVKASTVRDRVLTDDEARALIKACETENERRFVLLALTTGSRPQALMDLSVSQLDREHRLIHLNPEGRPQNEKKFRPIIPMTNAVYEACQSWPAGPVFVVATDHRKKLKGVKYVWNRLHVRSGLPDDVSPYTIRHTVATELRRQGVAEWDVSGYLGHKSPGSATTARYAHWRPDFMRSASEAMDKWWRRLNGSTTADMDAGRDQGGDTSLGEGKGVLGVGGERPVRPVDTCPQVEAGEDSNGGR